MKQLYFNIKEALDKCGAGTAKLTVWRDYRQAGKTAGLSLQSGLKTGPPIQATRRAYKRL